MDGDESLINADFDDARWGAPALTLLGGQARSLDEGMLLADAVLIEAGLRRTPWVQRSIAGWWHAESRIPGESRPLQISVSAGGVVQVDGDPFTREARRMNVSFDNLAQSLRERMQDAVRNAPFRVAVAHKREGTLESGRLKWYRAEDLSEASAHVRSYCERNDLKPFEFAAGEVHSGAGKLIGIVKFNGKIWSADDTRLVWQPAGSGVSIPPAMRGPSL